MSILWSTAASGLTVGIAIAVCVVLAVAAVLTEGNSRERVALFSRNATLVLLPLLVCFAYLVVIWGAKILTR
jgi:hypothetical protein